VLTSLHKEGIEVATGGRPRRKEHERAAITLVATVIIVIALGVIGLRVEGHLRPTSLAIGGTSSARGEELSKSHFGESSPFAVLLRGPAGAVERQGQRLAAVLRREPGVTVISPWDKAPAARRLPAPAVGAPPGERSQALLVLDFHRSLADAMRETVPQLEATLEAHVHAPVEAVQSGYATISRALQRESLSSAERAELLAAPLLLIVLLLVFRSVVAALIPLAFGAITVLAGRGVLVFLTALMSIEALSLVVCTMMGLALGVDYSLLIVSRFREELAAGHDPARAAALTRRSAGRTTVIAGATLFLSIFLSAFFQPGSLLVSLATALATVTALAVLIAWIALPALLTLLGPRINAGRIGRSRPGASSRVAALASGALRRPAVAALAIAVPLLALAAPALAFDTGSPGVDELSSSSTARKDSEAIAAAVGAGWQAPFILTAVSRRGPITTRSGLDFLAATQQRIGALPEVKAVIGPAALAAAARPLHSLAAELEPGGSEVATQLTHLGPRLHKVTEAVAELRSGLAEASAGSELLGEGSSRAGEGAELIAGGLGSADDGGRQASQALARLASGSKRLADGQRVASAGAYNLSLGLGQLLPNLTGQGLKRVHKLATRLEHQAASDPGDAAAAHEAAVLSSVLASNREELARLRQQAATLNSALGKLYSGGKRLHSGSQLLAGEGQRLSGGLETLHAATERLAVGLGELNVGIDALTAGLAEGSARTLPLEEGLSRADRRASRASERLRGKLAHLQASSPGVFESGFLTMAAIDGADPTRRSLAAEVVDIERGGTAARYLIVPEAGFNTAGSRRLGSELSTLAASIESRDGYRAGVSGGAAVLNDYGSATKSRLPLVIGSIVLITFLMLVALLRTPLLAALAVGLNLLSVGAAVGVVTLACKLPAGYPLGGHSYIDTVGAAAIFGVTFGLSIDYAVFLLARMRENYRETNDNAAAIRFGLDRTAGVITGAAAIMAAVFASFAIAPVATVSQMGLGLTIAVLLDATVVRIVLLPALMLLIGDRVWHTPAWLDRLLSSADSPAAMTAETTR
jgi:putative drug exporter of the RND superfamily